MTEQYESNSIGHLDEDQVTRKENANFSWSEAIAFKKDITGLDYFLAHIPLILVIFITWINMNFSPDMSLGLYLYLEKGLTASFFVLAFSYLLFFGIALAITEWEASKRAHLIYYKGLLTFTFLITTLVGIIFIFSILSEQSNLFALLISITIGLQYHFDGISFLYFESQQFWSILFFILILSTLTNTKIVSKLKLQLQQKLIEQQGKHEQIFTFNDISNNVKIPKWFLDPRVKKMPFIVRVLTWTIFWQQTVLMPFIIRSLFIDSYMFSNSLIFSLGALLNTLTWIGTGFLVLAGFEIDSELLKDIKNKVIQYIKQYPISLVMILGIYLIIDLLSFHVTVLQNDLGTKIVTLSPQINDDFFIYFSLLRALTPKYFSLILLTWLLYQMIREKTPPSSTRSFDESLANKKADLSEKDPLKEYDEKTVINIGYLLDKRPSFLTFFLAQLPMIIYILIKIIGMTLDIEIYQLIFPDLLEGGAFHPNLWLFFIIPETLIISGAILNMILGRKGFASLYFLQGMIFLMLPFFLVTSEFYHAKLLFSDSLWSDDTFYQVTMNEDYYLFPYIPRLIFYSLLAGFLLNWNAGYKLMKYRSLLKENLKLQKTLTSTRKDGNCKEVLAFIENELSRRVLSDISPAFLYLGIIGTLWPLRHFSHLLMIFLEMFFYLLFRVELIAPSYLRPYVSNKVISIFIIGPFLSVVLVLLMKLANHIKNIHETPSNVDNKFRLGGVLLGILSVLAIFDSKSILSLSFFAYVGIFTWLWLEKNRIQENIGETATFSPALKKYFSRVFQWYKNFRELWILAEERPKGDLLESWEIEPSDLYLSYRKDWEVRCKKGWILATIGNSPLIFIFYLGFLLILAEVSRIHSHNNHATSITEVVIGTSLLLILVLGILHSLIKITTLKDRQTGKLYLVPSILGSIILVLGLLFIKENLSLLLIFYGLYLTIINLRMYSLQRELRGEHAKIIDNSGNFIIIEEINIQSKHHPGQVIDVMLLLLIFLSPLILTIPLKNIWYLDYFFLINNYLRFLYYNTTRPFIYTLGYFLDNIIIFLTLFLLGTDYRKNSEQVIVNSKLLKFAITARTLLHIIGWLLNLENTPYIPYQTLIFPIIILGVSFFYLHQITSGKIAPAPYTIIAKKIPYQLSKRLRERLTRMSPEPMISDERVTTLDTVVTKKHPTITKQVTLIREILIPRPTIEEIKWTEQQARTYLINLLEEKGYIEVDQLPTHVGRIRVDFKKLLSELQFSSNFTLLWSSDGKIVYTDDYLEKEMLHFISRNRSITTAELARQFNLEVEVVSFKLKRWFVDGKLN